MSADLRYRTATASDSDVLADLVVGAPDQEITRVTMRLLGISRFEGARELFRIAWRAGENWKASTLAELDGKPVGLLQTGFSSTRITPRLAIAAARKLPPLVLLRMPRRLRIRARVIPHMPPGAYVISELHVTPARRGEGLGASILEHAECEARSGGLSEMALMTLTTNPARRLYERFGFQVRSTRTDPEFRRITGAEGNLLMVKRLW